VEVLSLRWVDVDEKWNRTAAAESAKRTRSCYGRRSTSRNLLLGEGDWTDGGGREGDFVKTPLICDLPVRPTGVRQAERQLQS